MVKARSAVAVASGQPEGEGGECASWDREVFQWSLGQCRTTDVIN